MSEIIKSVKANRPLADKGWHDELAYELWRKGEDHLDLSSPLVIGRQAFTLLGSGEQVGLDIRTAGALRRHMDADALLDQIHAMLPGGAQEPVEAGLGWTAIRRFVEEGTPTRFWVGYATSDKLIAERQAIRSAVEEVIKMKLLWSQEDPRIKLAVVNDDYPGEEFKKYENLLPRSVRLAPIVIKNVDIRVYPIERNTSQPVS